MSRPMPGPPEDWWYCTPPHGEPGLCTSDMHPAEYMPFTHLQYKHLTDAECMREWVDAAWDRWYAAADHIRGNKRLAARFERPENAARTWARFAALPHALEVTP